MWRHVVMLSVSSVVRWMRTQSRGTRHSIALTPHCPTYRQLEMLARVPTWLARSRAVDATGRIRLNNQAASSQKYKIMSGFFYHILAAEFLAVLLVYQCPTSCVAYLSKLFSVIIQPTHNQIWCGYCLKRAKLHDRRIPTKYPNKDS